MNIRPKNAQGTLIRKACAGLSWNCRVGTPTGGVAAGSEHRNKGTKENSLFNTGCRDESDWPGRELTVCRVRTSGIATATHTVNIKPKSVKGTAVWKAYSVQVATYLFAGVTANGRSQ